MSAMIQIRHVPDPLHRKLKARAAEAGMTLSDYLKRELTYLVARPTAAELAARFEALEPTAASVDVVNILAQARGAR